MRFPVGGLFFRLKASQLRLCEVESGGQTTGVFRAKERASREDDWKRPWNEAKTVITLMILQLERCEASCGPRVFQLRLGLGSSRTKRSRGPPSVENQIHRVKY